MGSSTLLDIIGAMILSSLLMLNIVRMTGDTQENSAQYVSELVVQQNLIEAAQLIERDLLRLGYLRGSENLAYVINAVSVADSNRIVFASDVDNNGVMDQVEYVTGTASQLTATANPRDLPLTRRINGVGRPIQSFGIIEFRFEYFNYTGKRLTTPVANRGEICTVSITLAVESPHFSDDVWEDYNAKAFWKQIRLALPNLRYK